MTQVNLSMKQKQNQGHREWTGGSQREGLGRGMEWEPGVSRYKVLYTKWISYKVLLYSTRNCIQYPVINHNGKEHLKNNVYVCICVCVCVCVYIYIYIYIYN